MISICPVTLIVKHTKDSLYCGQKKISSKMMCDCLHSQSDEQRKKKFRSVLFSDIY